MASSARAHFGEDITYQASRIPKELNGEEYINGTGPRQVSGVAESFKAINRKVL